MQVLASREGEHSRDRVVVLDRSGEEKVRRILGGDFMSRDGSSDGPVFNKKSS
jgi:hypothetical protein